MSFGLLLIFIKEMIVYASFRFIYIDMGTFNDFVSSMWLERGGTLEESSVEESGELESLAADDVSFEDLDEEDDLNGDTGLEIPEEFPDDYPILDNYIVTEAAYFDPDSLTGELVKLTLRYDDQKGF